MRMDIRTAQDNNDNGADLIGLDFMDDGTRFTITGTSSNDGVPVLTYIDPAVPLKDEQEHESTVKEVRTWYNKTCLLQATKSLSSNTRTFMNDLAYEAFRHLCPTKTYDVQLADPTRKAPTSYKAAGNREAQWFSQPKTKNKMASYISRHGSAYRSNPSPSRCARKHSIFTYYMT